MGWRIFSMENFSWGMWVNVFLKKCEEMVLVEKNSMKNLGHQTHMGWKFVEWDIFHRNFRPIKYTLNDLIGVQLIVSLIGGYYMLLHIDCNQNMIYRVWW